MVPKERQPELEKEVDLNIEVQRKILGLLRKVAQEKENKAHLEEMPSRYEKHYIAIGSGKADRCMDDRSPLMEYDNGELTGFDEETNTGAQFPGATGGLEDAVRKAGAEDDVWMYITKTYKGEEGSSPIALTGMHIDDNKGDIQTVEGIKARVAKSGEDPTCGDHLLKLLGKVRGISLTSEQIQDRIDKAQVVIPLTKDHAKNAILTFNTVPGQTFNTVEANHEGNNAFNVDLGEAYFRSGLIYDTMKSIGEPVTEEKTRQQFQSGTVRAMIRNSIQDAYGLVDGFDTAHVRTSPGMDIN